jgi:hypothetical protein
VTTRYSSFLVRLYLLDRGERVEIEHVQTGAKTRVASMEEATIWMREQMPPLSRAPPQGAREHTDTNE